ncbi:MAG: UspA domain protein [Ramlibacter sp.]|jgi:nucleotide-binding universal stress UspA family protein|nr:UspA domain protein [Ramlibacter sp.]
MFKHILLATDGSEASTHAAKLAVDLARTHGARLTALYVVDPYPYLGIGEANPTGFQAYMAAANEHAAQAHAAVAALCEESGKAGNPVELMLRVAEDVPATQGILRTAQEESADLIVVGSHGRSGLMRMVLGSVATKVVAQSHVPVLVVR